MMGFEHDMRTLTLTMLALTGCAGYEGVEEARWWPDRRRRGG